MNKYLKEPVLWVFIVLPYVYLSTIWDKLPARVPTHFDFEGKANDWSDKSSLLYLPGALTIGIYLLMLVIPYIDPKKKLQQMGSKYYNLRFLMTFFFSILAIFILYISSTGSLKNPNMLYTIIGALFAMLGNYFQTLRPNYFIGIRTPWTLESEQTWKKTHRLGGKIWMVGGVLIAFFSFFQSSKLFSIVFATIIGILVVVPVVYSYIEFQKEKRIKP
jgi:uncharacterized membrane protein